MISDITITITSITLLVGAISSLVIALAKLRSNIKDNLPKALKKQANNNVKSTSLNKFMLQEKAGELAGKVWNALSENGPMEGKDLKKAAKLKSDKELYLALGWLLREDKVEAEEVGREVRLTLK